MKKLLLMSTLMLTMLLSAREIKLTDNIKVKSNQTLAIGDISASFLHYDANWTLSILNESRTVTDVPEVGKKSYKLKGIFKLKGLTSNFNFSEYIKVDSKGVISLKADFTSNKPIATNTLCFSLNLPIDQYQGKTLYFDDKSIVLPNKYNKMSLFRAKKVTHLHFACLAQNLSIKGAWDVFVQDNRKFKGNSYSIRLMCQPAIGKITESSFQATISLKPHSCKTISICEHVNMGFTDEVANDEKGGWTDQGSANDLRQIKPGKQVMAGVTFDVIDPNQNDGKACIGFAGKARGYFKKSAVFDVKGDYKYLYLLHALAWAPREKEKIGTITVQYDDNTESKIPVICKQDVADWWGATAIENGAIGWSGENRKANVGLYVSKYKLNGKALKHITLTPRGNAVWMVVGMSLSNADIPTKSAVSPSYIIANKDWKPIQMVHEVEKGSALDFSFMQDAPAGKYGRVVIRNGHFEFKNKPGQKVRFYGNNLCFSAHYLSKEMCEKVAENFARMGYNSVRFHHHDKQLASKTSSVSTDLDAEEFDKLDYLFYCFKKRGLYITTDLYVSRRLKPGEIKGFGKLKRYELKALIPVHDVAFENWKTYSKNFLTHKNPYTGMTWAEDPALFSVSLVNENTIFGEWNKYPKIKELYLQKFAQWLQKNKKNPENENERASQFSRFLAERHIKTFQRMKDFLKNELNFTTPLSDANHKNDIVQSLVRETFDYVDNHTYWDHPKFVDRKWSLPYLYKQLSAISKDASVPRNIMPARVFGMPYMVTEFNYCFPNIYRSEGGPVMGAYAALQDWDGLYRFAYSHHKKTLMKPGALVGFDLVNDPITTLSDKIGILMFLRGDVKAAEKKIIYELNESAYDFVKKFDWQGSPYPEAFTMQGLKHQIGSLNTDKFKNMKQDKDIVYNLDTTLDDSVKAIESDTEQIQLNAAKKQLKVVTPKSEVLVVNGNCRLKGKCMEIHNTNGFATFLATSLDKKTLDASKRILVFHLTDVQNTKEKFRSHKRRIIESWGEMPLLVRVAKADVNLSITGENMTIWALDMAGRRKQQVPFKTTANGISFQVDSSFAKGTLAYEIIKE